MKHIIVFIVITVLGITAIPGVASVPNLTANQLGQLKTEAKNNNIKALQTLTDYYFNKKDYKNAYVYIQKGAELGDLISISNQGLYYLNGYGVVTKNYKKALNELQSAIHINSLEVYNGLGIIYDEGLGVPKNPNLARNYYEKAIHLGSEEARFNLAMLMMSYHPKLAFEMFHALAVYKKDPRAALMVGATYQFGGGAPINYAKAYQWYTITYNMGIHQKKIQSTINALTKKMTPAQIAEGKQLVKEYYAEQSNSE